ncbi:MAG: hypothetical protein ACHQFX_01680 [Chitinophagales bacterium]
MKRIKIIKVGGAALTLAILALSCTRETGKEVAIEDNDFSNKTLVQVYDATINGAATHVFIDAKQVTGSALAYATLFPSTSYAFSVDAGLRAFSIRNTTAGTTQAPINFSENMEVNKQYTIFTYDTTTAAKQITVVNNIVIPADTTARVKFANFIWSRTGTGPAVDVYSKLRSANVFSNIAPTQVTEYIPYAAAVADSMIVRVAGTAIALDTAVFNFTRKRSYTLIFRGRATNDEAGGALFPRTLAAFANY